MRQSTSTGPCGSPTRTGPTSARVLGRSAATAARSSASSLRGGWGGQARGRRAGRRRGTNGLRCGESTVLGRGRSGKPSGLPSPHCRATSVHPGPTVPSATPALDVRGLRALSGTVLGAGRLALARVSAYFPRPTCTQLPGCVLLYVVTAPAETCDHLPGRSLLIMHDGRPSCMMDGWWTGLTTSISKSMATYCKNIHESLWKHQLAEDVAQFANTPSPPGSR